MTMELELHATSHEVMRAVEALQEFGRERGVSEEELFGLALALEECGANIVDHGLRRDAAKTFQVKIACEDGVMTIQLRDRGPEFDPTAAPARKSRAEDDDPVGGWGIQLVRRYTDRVHYQREGSENVLSLVKKLKSIQRPKNLGETE